MVSATPLSAHFGFWNVHPGFGQIDEPSNCMEMVETYRVVPGHRNWQIETAVWNWASFFTVGLETRCSDLGSFLMIYRNDSLELGRFLHCGFRNPLAAIWAVS